MAAPSHTSVKPRDGMTPLVDRWPLLGQRRPLVGYLCGIVALDLAAIVFFSISGVFRWSDVLTFTALMACGAVCIEATRRLGMPAGVYRDLLSAWWLPAALLLPPLYALLAPIPLQFLLQKRVRATVVYRRVVSSAAIGLAGCAASLLFHAVVGDLKALTRGEGGPILVAIGCAALFTVINTALIAVAAHTADPESRWREVLWNRENLLLDVVELCLGVLVSITCGLNLALLVLALPPGGAAAAQPAARPAPGGGPHRSQDGPAERRGLAAGGRHRDRQGASHGGDARVADRRHRPFQEGERHLRPPDR
ncbi:hypothetical protein GCM10018952_75890 [Streptosporangium vulgare]